MRRSHRSTQNSQQLFTSVTLLLLALIMGRSLQTAHAGNLSPSNKPHPNPPAVVPPSSDINSLRASHCCGHPYYGHDVNGIRIRYDHLRVSSKRSRMVRRLRREVSPEVVLERQKRLLRGADGWSDLEEDYEWERRILHLVFVESPPLRLFYFEHGDDWDWMMPFLQSSGGDGIQEGKKWVRCQKAVFQKSIHKRLG